MKKSELIERIQELENDIVKIIKGDIVTILLWQIRLKNEDEFENFINITKTIQSDGFLKQIPIE